MRWRVCIAALTAVILSGCREGSEPGRGWVIISPALTEIVWHLDETWAEKNVLAVDTYSAFPAAADRLRLRQPIGSLLDPSLEKILLLKPAEIFVQGVNEKLSGFCETRGIRLTPVLIETFADLRAKMEETARRIGTPTALKRWKLWREKFEKEKRALPAGSIRRPKVFLSVHRLDKNRDLHLSAGTGTFLQEIVSLLPVEQMNEKGWYRKNMEQLIRYSPDEIWELHTAEIPEAEKAEARRVWKRWLPQAKLKFFSGSHLLVPGPRLNLVFHDFAVAVKEAGG